MKSYLFTYLAGVLSGAVPTYLYARKAIANVNKLYTDLKAKL